jgi:ribokinase
MAPPSAGAELIITGNACVDIFLPPHAPPPPGGISLIPAPVVQTGGNGANTAITAARLGIAAAFAGVLGDDLFGRHVRGHLEEEGVGVYLLAHLPGRISPTTHVINHAGGERSFIHHPGTNADFALPEAAIAVPCRIFHLAAPELLGAFWPEGCLEAARRLKAAGRILSLDTFAAAGDAASDARIEREHRPLLELVDMAFPNEEEARLITGRRDPAAMADRLHDLGVGLVAIKRGERGALLSTGGRKEEVPAEPVEAVDTCGAGDSFAAGFLAGRLRGLDPLASTRLGCALGALCVERRGSLTGTADRQRLEGVLRRLAFPR